MPLLRGLLWLQVLREGPLHTEALVFLVGHAPSSPPLPPPQELCPRCQSCYVTFALGQLWFLLMMGVLFCCGAGFFIRRRMYPPPLIEEPAFNVSYTRQPPNSAPVLLSHWARHMPFLFLKNPLFLQVLLCYPRGEIVPNHFPSPLDIWTAFGCLACTPMRSSECHNWRVTDLDRDESSREKAEGDGKPRKWKLSLTAKTDAEPSMESQTNRETLVSGKHKVFFIVQRRVSERGSTQQRRRWRPTWRRREVSNLCDPEGVVPLWPHGDGETGTHVGSKLASQALCFGPSRDPGQSPVCA
ncbi:Vesicular, overexpressed in cancer, prosurvival protein 1 [Tupaia chinensis]|uniref:WW domain binding protein VOPP1 n=1 Tax=Tupaia chinensis TaxID=246437 RepID=L9KSK4_TUPCH|nr:Vesicular, overexpressed in cancer, prosurvival protein 1 [Tupaia chinensis]